MDQDEISSPSRDREMWTEDDVAKYLKTTVSSVKRFKRELGLPSHRISYKMVRYSPSEVEAWARSRCSTPAPQRTVGT